jgi:hypothetical protein
MSDVERLMALLVSEISKPRSFWRPYIRILPSLNDIDPPFLWPERIVSSLNGSAAFFYLSHIEEGFRTAAANVCAAASHSHRHALRALACDDELLRWAYAVVRTRSLEGSDGHGAMLLPLLDMANHAPLAPPMHLPFANGTGTAGLVSASSVAAGEEVLVRYEESSNANLLAVYGFIVPSNPHDCVIVLGHLPPAPSLADPAAAARADSDAADAAALDAERRRVMAEHGLFDLRRNPRTLGPDGSPSPALMRYLRLCCLPRRDWARADEVAAGAPGGPAVEACAWRLLARRAEQILAGYACAAAGAGGTASEGDGGERAAGGPAESECGRDARGDGRVRAVHGLLAGEQVRPPHPCAQLRPCVRTNCPQMRMEAHGLAGRYGRPSSISA